MTPSSPAASRPAPCEVLIAGGGVAALEAAFALRELAPGQVNVRVLAPGPEFVYRANTVKEPFTIGSGQRYPLAALVADAGAELIVGALARVDADRRIVHTEAGAELTYDALLLGLGAVAHERYPHVTTIDDRQIDDHLHGLVQDVEGGYVKRLAFMIPAPIGWPMPVYDLALLTAQRAWEMQAELSVTILTPEPAPLALLGEAASREVAQLLAERGIEVITSADCEVPQAKTIDVQPGARRLEFDRIVALPQLRGPALGGVPHDDAGFIPVDDHGQVKGVEAVFAAGDATDGRVKHGGLASRQADAAARSIAALAGAPVEPEPMDPVLEVVLLTGDRPRYFRARLTGDGGSRSQAAGEPATGVPPKMAARYLSEHLEAARSRG